MWWLQLPHPRDATRDQLFAWMVLRDVAAQPLEIKHALVDRLEEELLKGIELDATDAGLTESQRRQVSANLQTLKYEWFVLSVDRYGAVKKADQVAFLATKIKVIEHFTTLSVDDPDEAGRGADDFFTDIGRWIEQAPADQSDQMSAAVIDGVTAWLALSDLRETPYSIRQQLTIRIVAELEAGMRLDEVLLELDDSQMQTLIANSELILQAWIYMGAEQYGKIEAGQRDAFVGQQLDRVDRWGVMEALTPANEASPNALSRLEAAGRMGRLLQGWIDDAPAEQRDDVKDYISHLSRSMLWRQFGS